MNPIETVLQFLERINQRDADKLAALMTEDYLFVDSLGHEVRGADVLPLLSGDVRPGMVAALRACKDRFKVGCITNNMRDAGKGAGMAGEGWVGEATSPGTSLAG